MITCCTCRGWRTTSLTRFTVLNNCRVVVQNAKTKTLFGSRKVVVRQKTLIQKCNIEHNTVISLSTEMSQRRRRRIASQTHLWGSWKKTQKICHASILPHEQAQQQEIFLWFLTNPETQRMLRLHTCIDNISLQIIIIAAQTWLKSSARKVATIGSVLLFSISLSRFSLLSWNPICEPRSLLSWMERASLHKLFLVNWSVDRLVSRSVGPHRKLQHVNCHIVISKRVVLLVTRATTCGWVVDPYTF